jgi:hypothetical protein
MLQSEIRLDYRIFIFYFDKGVNFKPNNVLRHIKINVFCIFKIKISIESITCQIKTVSTILSHGFDFSLFTTSCVRANTSLHSDCIEENVIVYVLNHLKYFYKKNYWS